MRNLPGLRLTLMLFALIFSAKEIWAEDTACSGSVSSPADVSLQLSLQDGQTTFREGETITLKLSYSSTAKGKYEMSTRNYDRSGPMGEESFCLTPSGRDPLADYFSFGMFDGGGLSGIHDLDETPFTMTLELNEWASLSPGTYHLYIENGRVTEVVSHKTSRSGTSRTVRLQSNSVDFQVIAADSQWQSEQLAAALKRLDSTPEDEAKHAARVLRFLNSEDAAREMAQRFSGANEQPRSWEFMFGLLGSRHRALVIQELKAAISAPQHPITVNFLRTLALLEIYSNPEYHLPYDPAKKDEWQKKMSARNKTLEALMKQHQDELESVIATKTGEARAISLKTILVDSVTPGATDKPPLRQQLVASWDALPMAMRNELLGFRWELVGGPEFLPVLRHIVSSPPATDYSRDRIDRGIALRRIYELSPAEGRDFILKEIARERTDVTIAVLGLLPEKELPEIEQPVLARLRSGNHSDVDYQLVDRYATVQALAEVRSIYEKSAGKWACAPQSALLRYFLRVDRDYGVAEVAEALNLRKTTGCYQTELSELREFVSLPQVEKIAIAALNDPSVHVVTSAAAALASYGSAKAEAALRKRLEQLHKEWKSPVEKPEGTSPAFAALNEQIMLESALVQALTNGQAWLYGPDKLQQLKKLVSSNEQQQIDQIIYFWQKDNTMVLSLSWFPNLDQLQYTVGYMNGNGMKHLKQKLSQLPAGTHLSCVTTALEHQKHREEFEAVQETASMAGLILDIQISR
ncbi:MAG: hypothetical protein DMG65_08005 [Candidatus Angelobacter sp. Gp1-AA117]|nr:MAG: hypothetical protein DMG65_08005 [Candidatus Angelobacter sp. Gp1-AA117]